MKNKKEVYVKVDTPKKAKKLKKTLDMFFEPHTGKAIGNSYYNGAKLFDNTWCAIIIEKELENETEVSIKELKNILAIEHLKEGDVVVMRSKSLGKIILDVRGKNGETIGVKNELFVDSGSRYNCGIETIGKIDFIRYATEEEKQLLNPKKELEVGKWYNFSCKHNPEKKRGIYLVDKVEEEEVWFKCGLDFSDNVWIEDDWYNISHNWTEATPQEVEKSLIDEANRIGHTYIEYHYNPEENELCGMNKGRLESVFCDGKWEQPVDKFAELKEAHNNSKVIQ